MSEPLDIESVIGKVKPAETQVPICLDGTLAGEYERLEALLREAGPARSLGDEESAEALAERIEALREEMADARVWFTFRALSRGRWSGFRTSVPMKQDGQTEEEHDEAYHLWCCKVVAASCVDPVMSAEQADRLSRAVSNGQWVALFNAAWTVNNENNKIPFSAAASAMSRRSGRKSRRPDPSASPDPGSSDESPDPSPSTSTTSLADPSEP